MTLCNTILLKGVENCQLMNDSFFYYINREILPKGTLFHDQGEGPLHSGLTRSQPTFKKMMIRTIYNFLLMGYQVDESIMGVIINKCNETL